ncbi:MAG: lytic transglycosylase domain-containing protein [Alcanivoracaceae bacterium]|jgi:soluble lytic murein transglycosylase-like protein|nr:lytic transglycosylase domain-containing protein [Alcanivoracaceae bacterium]
MGRLITATASLLLLLTATAPAAGERIFTYKGPDGSIMFTDRDQARVPGDYTLLSVRKGWDYTPRKLTAKIRDQYDADIEYAAISYQVDPALIKAVIHAESHFDPHAVSRAGAQGLMQLMPETAAYLRVHRPFDARQNILGGTRFLSYLMGKFDRLDHVLAAYNAGEGNVRRHGGIPPFPETQRYVVKVSELLNTYRPHFGESLAQR